ncbi:MAG: molybdopterin molybdotransferase MoeA [Desulfohalobiaceae bacterium]
MAAEFFDVLSVQGFLQTASQLARIQETETLDTPLALQRILAQDLDAPEDLPAFARAAMDGYAVQAADTFGSSESNPQYLEKAQSVGIGTWPEFELWPGQCAPIVTGAVLPNGADSVVMQEYVQDLGQQEVEVRRPVAPGENMLQKGEDCSQGSQVLAAGSRLRPQDLALLCSLGLSSVEVFRRPKLGIISTGDELVPAHRVPGPGQIRDVNTYSIQAWLQSAGFQSQTLGIVPDNLLELQRVLEQALLECDVLLLSGGSSVGYRDLTIQALESLQGCEILLHGVAISPGKPTILARQGSKAVLGLPGQVTSVQVVLCVLVLPLLQHISGQDVALEPGGLQVKKPALLSRNVFSKQGREDYVRVSLEPGEDGLDLAVPVLGKSGLLRTMLQAQGLLRIPAELEGLEKGARVEVYLL